MNSLNKPISIDERDAAIPKATLQRTHAQRLSCLVLGEEEDSTRRERFFDHLQDALNLGFAINVVRRVDQFLERGDLIRVQVNDAAKVFGNLLFETRDFILVGWIVVSNQFLQSSQCWGGFVDLRLRCVQASQTLGEGSVHRCDRT